MGAPSHGSSTSAIRDFGRLKMLDRLTPAVHSNTVLRKLAQAMIAEPDPAKDGRDAEENVFVPAGYTYLGQFVDHDLTFDAHSNFDDPTSLEHAANARTPRFDLDCVYGRGPEDQPYLYKSPADGTLLLGEKMANGVRDVPRNSDGRAIIGDPRNDENSIVVQLQSAFIRFHNALVARARKAGLGTGDAFKWARTETRRHYQRIVLDDYLPRVINDKAGTVKPIIDALKAGRRPALRLYDLAGAPYMPVEFSVAAYRFGHSLVRTGYRLWVKPGDKPLSAPDHKRLFPIFDQKEGGLLGFRDLAKTRHIDWTLFFSAGLPAGQPMDNTEASPNNAKGVHRTQLAYKLDTMLVDPLGMLPKPIADDVRSLAERNLLRGRDFGLPSGQDAAAQVGATVLTDDQLSVRSDGEDFAKRTLIKDVDPSFAGHAPLWFYVLAEADQEIIKGVNAGKDPATVGSRLGELGSAIVLETFVGLMLKDDDSVLNARTPWRSINGNPTFSMAELFAEIGTPI
jgi:Animal haem peroxidase